MCGMRDSDSRGQQAGGALCTQTHLTNSKRTLPMRRLATIVCVCIHSRFYKDSPLGVVSSKPSAPAMVMSSESRRGRIYTLNLLFTTVLPKGMQQQHRSRSACVFVFVYRLRLWDDKYRYNFRACVVCVCCTSYSYRRNKTGTDEHVFDTWP